MTALDLTIVVCLLESLTSETKNVLDLPYNRSRLLPKEASSEPPLSEREDAPALDLRSAKLQLTLADYDKPYDWQEATTVLDAATIQAGNFLVSVKVPEKADCQERYNQN